MANVKKIGNDFENDFIDILSRHGFWAHKIAGDKSGAQPFDVVATKNGLFFGFDCKTCSTKFFNLDRVELNQILAFRKLRSSTGTATGIGIGFFVFKRRDDSIWITDSRYIDLLIEAGERNTEAGMIRLGEWMCKYL